MALKDKLTSTNRKGVFYRKHDTRRHGAGVDSQIGLHVNF
jgi:hypothetical protein